MNACYFDMDGTLIDSRADLAATVNHTRRDLGLAEKPQDEILSHVGRGARHLLANAIPEAGGDASIVERFMGHYGEHMLESVTLYPGVRRTLEELRDRGWLLGVNTAKPRFATLAILEHFGLKRLFGDAIVAGGDCAEMKPSALPLRQCASLMRGHRVSAYDWMVGDNWTDVECARNAGVKSAFCAFGFGILGETSPTVKINRFDELLRFLKREED
ncbi:MAG: HAD hydrolase-like protein [Kiritimatiellae bacterium]|nr:HAD hydrolase-like protein [Kiritimatiellia bacterium]MBR4604447.1 HAD hydrolase-like protein [Kiritimatiellia bacterium]